MIGNAAIYNWERSNKYSGMQQLFIGIEVKKIGNEAINCGGCSSRKLGIQQ